MCLQVNLALCCKGMLPILYMGHVSVRLYEEDKGRPLTQLTRCLKKQPDGVSHLELFSHDSMRGTHQLIDLRCAASLHGAGSCMCLPSLCQSIIAQGGKRF